MAHSLFTGRRRALARLRRLSLEQLETRALLAAVTEFQLAAGSLPSDIVRDGAGNLWFTEFGSDRIGRITPAGVTTEFSLVAGSGPTGIAAGPDGLIYFTEQSSDHIGRINPAAGSNAAIQASLVEFVLPGMGSAPSDITAGPDGALWFTQSASDQIGRLTTAGAITEFAVPGTGSVPTGITVGPDGALWFTETLSHEIGRITTAGVITNEFTGPAPFSNPNSITTGPDGALWFTEFGSDQIARLTTGGAIAFFALNNGAAPQGIAAGPDGKLYFAESGRDRIGRITTAGVVTELGAGIAPGSAPTALAFTGNTLFFTEQLGNQIGRLGGNATADAGAPITILATTPDTFIPNDATDLSTFDDIELENLYVFRSLTNANNTVFTLTSNALAGEATPPTFDPTRVYALNVDQTGDALADFRLLAKFSPVDANGAQEYVLQRVAAKGLGVIAHGNTGANLALPGGGTTRAGLQDDPFFFDQVGYDNFVHGSGTFPRPPGTAQNFYGPDKNVLSVVVELPSAQLAGGANNPNNIIGVWGTLQTQNDGVQIDRVGRPLIDTILIPPVPRDHLTRGERRDDFVMGQPVNDRQSAPLGFRDDMIFVLTDPTGIYKRTQADANFLADALLPDLLMFQLGNPNGFGTVVGPGPGFFTGPFAGGQVLGNGRRFSDDVVDIEFNLLTNGVIPTDNVADDNTPLVNSAPVANPDTYTTPENTILTVPFSGVLGNDADVDGPDQVAALVSDVSNGMLVLNANGSFTYTPNPDFIGTDTFTYQVNDTAASNNLSNITTVTINVTAAPPAGLPEITTLNAPGAPGTATIEDDADNPGNNVLIVTGTSGNDVIIIERQPRSGGQLRVVRNGHVLVSLIPPVPRIVAFGLEGNDKIIVSASFSQPATLFGDAGKDQLVGGRGNDQLDGGDGNDVIVGGGGNDTILGDSGNDVVNGGVGDDLLLGGDGNDVLDGALGNDHLYGQAGNDMLVGGVGNNILVGGDGNDKLIARFGRNILIGGNGKDQLYGNAGDDILIGGSTAHGEDDAALQAILDEWTSANAYTLRADNIRSGGGTNGAFVFDDTTVLDDGAADILIGSVGRDWFWAGVKDKIKDRRGNEQVN
jgi:streptogramin lyase